MEITQVTVNPDGAGAMPPAQEAQAQLETNSDFEFLAETAARMAAQKALQWSGCARAGGPGMPSEERLAFAQELMRQEDEIRLTRPDFDLSQTLGESAAFRALILAGEPVARALEYIEPESGRMRAEEAVLERIRRRNARPQGMAQANRPAADDEARELSEEDMRRIDAQLKRGRKVYLK